jgi:hypothetical protein
MVDLATKKAIAQRLAEVFSVRRLDLLEDVLAFGLLPANP